jgi:microsomal dipeptidase-like Zn-dependent dipeptidase
MIAIGEHRTSEDPDDLEQPALATHHGRDGAPSFLDFPNFRSGAHQQHHITQIYRAYLGGMRVMSALALQNRGLDYGMGWTSCCSTGRACVDTSSDLDVVRAHVQVMRELAALNARWMEIAYTPSQARAIVRDNKLAVILGVEVPQLGQPSDGSVADQVQALVALGIRQITPIHALDNALGGAAVFNDTYNAVSDWVNRPADTRHAMVALSGALGGDIGDSAFYEVETDPEEIERILLTLGKPPRIVLSDTYPRPGHCNSPFLGVARTGCLHPFLSVTPLFRDAQSPYAEIPGGHRNVRRLTDRGREYVSRLVSRAVLVDVAHMSDLSLADTLETVDAACSNHPVMISHAGFRKLPFTADHSKLAEGFTRATGDAVRDVVVAAAKEERNKPAMLGCVRPPESKDAAVDSHDACPCKVLAATEVMLPTSAKAGSVNKGFLPKEFDVRTDTVDELAKRGGVLGVFVGQDPIDERKFEADDYPDGMTALPFANDCAGSSKGFAAALLFAQGHMSEEQVAIASDFTMHPSLVPRFGAFACALYLKAGSGSASGLQHLETKLNPGQYRFDEQRGAVRYTAGTKTCAPGVRRDSMVPCGRNVPLAPYRMAGRIYDFNVDGYAHMGMLPDLLQDVKNIGVDPGPLFRSAEGTIAMWEKAWAAAGCDRNDETCNPPREDLDPNRTCRDACPGSWNAGAPLRMLAELHDTCDPLKEIRFDGGILKYSPREADGGHGLALVARQGDWAVYEVDCPVSWRCGNDAPTRLDCPQGTRYVKVRRVLETRLGADPICDNPPGFPMVGNKRVMFQCLAAPP